MSRIAIFAYGVISYLVFFGVFLYAIGFIGGFLTPTTLDGAPDRPLWEALAINLGLLAAFAIQHSGMARPAFKRWWTKMIPEAAERSTYVLVSSLALVALFILWEPIGGVQAAGYLEAVSFRDPLGRTATTGYEDLKNIAIGRLFLDNIPHVKTHWPMLTPFLSQIALTFGCGGSTRRLRSRTS